ncbi:bacteriocin maturation protein [Paenibacillus profundus]|uniref:Bacteriocin maturation protein n=1 Tax=Paenibacillus profundus TaxID=1173085 RepID=A0ABS8YE52_9BACL|nr:bacteriocin maturation protein [Paenibacillus profundus]MCE5169832.1 bacteriocin maturation protein [Paenibacillus profundus]
MEQNSLGQGMSEAPPSSLSQNVLRKYAAQLQFLNSFGKPGAPLFESYRQSKVLAIGSGPFLLSLATALFDSGLSRFHVLVTDAAATDQQRLMKLQDRARRSDSGASIDEISLPKEGQSYWREAIRPFDSILYVSQKGDIEELRAIHAACREEKKTLLPALCIGRKGLAGPLVHPDSEGCWESAWRRIHRSALGYDSHPLPGFSPTAGALLANVIVFEWFKKVTGVTELERKHPFYLLDLETWEGSWHSYFPHPLVTGRAAAKWVQHCELRLRQTSGRSEPDIWFPYFKRLTSASSGIFHIWEEGDLKQLPLAQCRVQPADPATHGPAELLPDIVCSGITHEEARREAALAGIEAYAARMAGSLISALPPPHGIEWNEIETKEYIGVGAGETFAEGVCRGLQKCLNDELGKRQAKRTLSIVPVHLHEVEDERCLFYLQALTTLQGMPAIGLEENICGFPAVWVHANDRWHGSTGLNTTAALRRALQQALQLAQNEVIDQAANSLNTPLIMETDRIPLHLVVPASSCASHVEVLGSALQILERNRKRLIVFDLELEPFVTGAPIEVFGVLMHEEVSP